MVGEKVTSVHPEMVPGLMVRVSSLIWLLALTSVIFLICAHNNFLYSFGSSRSVANCAGRVNWLPCAHRLLFLLLALLLLPPSSLVGGMTAYANAC